MYTPDLRRPFRNRQTSDFHSASQSKNQFTKLMAKGGTLTRIKSVLKKMQSFKLGRSNSTAANNSSDDDGSYAASSKDLHAVYVGKSRRRYLITSDVLENPLLRELVERRNDEEEESMITVGCEVVLFEHLLWMLENADPLPESLDELVEFYAC